MMDGIKFSLIYRISQEERMVPTTLKPCESKYAYFYGYQTTE